MDPATGKAGREKTALYGKGDRYKVRYLDPDGRERSKSPVPVLRAEVARGDQAR
ncbi:hypothetical protein Acsp05_70490 [Actinokineospora sp. NBRC 105648]|nr:hypothetical protein Acsp05_70490 [Actinokineospora sp. NBRC 105648]